MATIAKKCNVCGKMYKAYNYVEITESSEDEEPDISGETSFFDYEVLDYQPNGFEFVTIKEDMDIQYDFDNNDLCPECMTIFENFVTGKIPSATGNPVVLEDAAPVNAVSVEVTGGSENTTITRVGKNLLDYINPERTTFGVTFKYDSVTGSVHVSGTATNNAWSDGGISETTVAPYTRFDAGTYIISGITGQSKARVQAWYDDGQSDIQVSTVNGSAQFTISKPAKLYIRISVAKGLTVDETIYPMLRHASVESDRFEPCHKTIYSVGDDIRLLTGSNTLTASEGTITIKYKKAIKGKMEVES